MHTVLEFVMGAYLAILSGVASLASWIEITAGHPGHQSYAAASVVGASLVLCLLCAMWATITQLRSNGRRHSMRTALSRAQAEIRFRETLISACPEAIAVLGSDMGTPLSYRGGAALLQACLDGPDAAVVAARLESLLANGTAFSVIARTASFPAVNVRGTAVGARAALFFRIDTPAAETQADLAAALDALPLPVWIRNRHLVLVWANRAFLTATGAPTLRDAQLTDASIEPCERDLARTASEGADVRGARRYAVMSGERRALELDLKRLPDRSVAGFAVDTTERARAEAKLQLTSEAFGSILNALDTAVAIFDSEQRLTGYNAAYVRLWHLPETWLEARPSLSDMFDRLREMRRVPEQRDFAAWKREHLRQFEEVGQAVSETWHLPSGMSVDVQSLPFLLGGSVYLFRDISEHLRKEASHQLLVRSQRAMLNVLGDATALFGTDGRLKMHNDAFSSLWSLSQDETSGEPHLIALADLCAERFGRDGIWSMIAAGVNSAEPERLGEWSQLVRADGRALTLSLNRLPDGCTLVTFNDLSDVLRFQTELVQPREASAA